MRIDRTLCEAQRMSDTEFVGSDEASEIIGVHRATFLRWVAAGEIEPVHQMPGVNGAKLFRRTEVLALKTAHDSEPTAVVNG